MRAIRGFRRKLVLVRVIVQVQCILVGCLSRMAVDGGHSVGSCDWEGRWNHVRKFLERPGPFTHPDFEPSTEVMQECFNETMHM